jgi:hypothetical protein
MDELPAWLARACSWQQGVTSFIRTFRQWVRDLG